MTTIPIHADLEVSVPAEQASAVEHEARCIRLMSIEADMRDELLTVDAYTLDGVVRFTTALICKWRPRAKAKDPSHLSEQEGEEWKRGVQ